MINEWSRLLGQPSTTGYTRFQLIFEGRLNEAEATTMREGDFDYLYLRLSAQHALILITPKPLKGAFCGTSPSFFHFVRQEKFPFDWKRLSLIRRISTLSTGAIQTLFILMSDAGGLFKGFKQSSKSPTWHWNPGKYLKQDSRLQEMVLIKTQSISDAIISERPDVVQTIAAHNGGV